MGLESFSADDMAGMSAEALEKLQAQMRENSRQVKAMKKDEAKQKAKDDKLVEILMRFIKATQRTDLVSLIVRLLNENVPATFILAIILLSNEDIQREVGVILALPMGEVVSGEEGGGRTENLELSAEAKSHQKGDKKDEISQEEKFILNMWTQSILASAIENPYKILRTVKDFEGNIKSTALQLFCFILRDFFEKKGKKNFDFEQIQSFGSFMLKGIIDNVQKHIDQFQLKA